MMSACSTSTYSSQGEAWNEQVLEVRRVSISNIYICYYVYNYIYIYMYVYVYHMYILYMCVYII